MSCAPDRQQHRAWTALRVTARSEDKDPEADQERLQTLSKDEAMGRAEPGQEQLELLNASAPLELDEDEGFSDWTQKSEPQQQQSQGFGEPGAGGRLSPSEDRSHGCACEDEEGEARSPTRASLEELNSGPCGEPQETLLSAEEALEENPEQPMAPSPWERGPEQDSPPLSPSATLLHRSESLSHAMESSVKKPQSAKPASKIEERLEQYTQAVETAGRTPRLSRQTSIELPNMVVANTKTLWESGEVQAQSGTRPPACKDIVAGDMSRKVLWERRGAETTVVQSAPSGKRYKFVATGHGKYEKVLVDENSGPLAPL